MPSVLVECGFLSNPRGRGAPAGPGLSAKIGKAIADGLEAYEVLLSRTGAGGCRLTAGNRLFPPPTHAMMKRYDRPYESRCRYARIPFLPKPFFPSRRQSYRKTRSPWPIWAIPWGPAHPAKAAGGRASCGRVASPGHPVGQMPGAQAEAAARIEPVLSPEEADVMRRGRMHTPIIVPQKSGPGQLQPGHRAGSAHGVSLPDPARPAELPNCLTLAYQSYKIRC